VTLSARRWLLAVASVLSPVVVMSAFLMASRWLPERWFTGSTHYAALATASALGFLLVWLIPMRWQWRFLASIVNGIAMVFVSFFGSYALVCSVFQDCP
jgi:hypothetical protein